MGFLCGGGGGGDKAGIGFSKPEKVERHVLSCPPSHVPDVSGSGLVKWLVAYWS